MTPHEIPARKTELTIPALWNALLIGWETMGVNPTRCAVELKLAHIKLETGLRACWNWNLGNTKSGTNDGKCWQYFSCGEEIPEGRVKAIDALLPGHLEVRSRYARNGVPYASVWIKAPHPWTKFQAFETLEEGIAGQLGYLKRHPKVLAALMTGDPTAYNDALVAAAYYTAGKSQYLSALKANLNDVVRVCRELDWGDVC